MSGTKRSDEPYVVGVDVGTTLTKAVSFAADGTVLRRAATETVVHRPGPGRYEQDAGQVVASVRAVLDELVPGPVAAIGVTAQGDGLWLVDGEGRPVHAAISWLDARAAGIVDEWQANGLLELAFRRTGSVPFPGSAGPLLAWFDRHEPEVLERAATAGYCKDVVLQGLTGVRATDVSDASAPFLDPSGRDYDQTLVDAFGLGHRRHLLAPISPAPAGALRASIGTIPAGTPVVAAPYDLPASAWGAGVADPGDGLLIVGTTLACQVVRDRLDHSEPAEPAEPSGLTLSTWQEGRWLRALPAMVGTAGLDWVLRLVGASPAELPELLASGRSDGLTVLPYFAEAGERAPFLEPNARARIDGLHAGLTRADIVRATCEGIAYSARHCLTAAGLTGALTACGGGLRSRAWAQIFADVLDRPIRLVGADEVGARGAAQAALQTIGAPALPPLALADTVGPSGNGGHDERYHRYLDQLTHARSTWRSPS